jgi:hypothetical protein
LATFFDDIWIIDEFKIARKAFRQLRDAFAEEGLEISLTKTVIFSEIALNAKQLEECAREKLQVRSDGVKILGAPVGTEAYIKACLLKEVDDAFKILDKVVAADTEGNLNKRWATPQGLYHLVRDCANQLLRHLLRTVDPKYTMEIFTVR